MRTLTAFRSDLRFQVRHGLYTAYAVVVLFYALLLLNLPAGGVGVVTVLILFTDTSVLGFFFMGGILLLERRQGVTAALFVTPLRPAEYLVSKVVSLTFMALLASGILMLVARVPARGFPVGFLGIALSSVFFILTGIAIAARSETVNGYFFRGTLFSLLFTIPLFDYLGLFRIPLGWLLPTHGSLVLMDAMFHPKGPGATAWGGGVLLIWCGLAWAWAHGWFTRWVVHREGGLQ